MRGMDTAALRKAYDDLLADTTRAVLAGEPRPYYNHDAVDTARLSALGDDLGVLAEQLRGLRAG